MHAAATRWPRAIVVQHKTQRPVQFEITPAARSAVQTWIKLAGLKPEDFQFPSHTSTRKLRTNLDGRTSHRHSIDLKGGLSPSLRISSLARGWQDGRWSSEEPSTTPATSTGLDGAMLRSEEVCRKGVRVPNWRTSTWRRHGPRHLAGSGVLAQSSTQADTRGVRTVASRRYRMRAPMPGGCAKTRTH